ncbi:MAG TPA: DMT family transporter [Vicinamibacterales bacterium]|nr:DMT family transporter [Vicinamibacterales bacterium]
MNTSADTRGRSLLIVLVIVWGASWPAIKVGVSAMPPVWFACLRYVVATVCAFGFVAVRGELRRPSPSDWRLVTVSGVLQMAAYSALTAVALTRLPPGRASVLAFSTPLWVAPLSAWWLDERFTWRTLTGVGTGLAGVLVIVSPALRHGERSQLPFYGLLLCAAAAWAVSIVFVRAHRFQSSALALAPWQMLVAVFLLLPLAATLEGAWPHVPSRAMAALSYVGPVATAFAYWAAVEVGRFVRATTMSMVLLAVPGLGLLLSTIALHESLNVSLELGILLIGSGIWTVTGESGPVRMRRAHHH